MALFLEDGSPFSCGACHYFAQPAAPGDSFIRPFLSIFVEGYPLQAAVDTGGFFLILSPKIAGLIGLIAEEGEHFNNLVFRGMRTTGHLHRVTVTFDAEYGEPFNVDVTALVPEGEWRYPNFLGWPFCLEKLRFAFDPNPNDPTDGQFHFGPLGEPI